MLTTVVAGVVEILSLVTVDEGTFWWKSCLVTVHKGTFWWKSSLVTVHTGTFLVEILSLVTVHKGTFWWKSSLLSLCIQVRFHLCQWSKKRVAL